MYLNIICLFQDAETVTNCLSIIFLRWAPKFRREWLTASEHLGATVLLWAVCNWVHGIFSRLENLFTSLLVCLLHAYSSSFSSVSLSPEHSFQLALGPRFYCLMSAWNALFTIMCLLTMTRQKLGVWHNSDFGHALLIYTSTGLS